MGKGTDGQALVQTQGQQSKDSAVALIMLMIASNKD